MMIHAAACSGCCWGLVRQSRTEVQTSRQKRGAEWWWTKCRENSKLQQRCRYFTQACPTRTTVSGMWVVVTDIITCLIGQLNLNLKVCEQFTFPVMSIDTRCEYHGYAVQQVALVCAVVMGEYAVGGNIVSSLVTCSVWARGNRPPLCPFTSPPFTLFFSVFYFFPFSLSYLLYLFFLLFHPFPISHSTRIVPLHFQARCRRRPLDLALVFLCLFYVICIF